MKPRIISAILIACCLQLVAAGGYAATGEYARVLILQDAQSLSLKIGGPFELTDASGKRVLYRKKSLKTTVTAYDGAIMLAGKSFFADKLNIKSDDPVIVAINGRAFKGNAQLIRNSNNRLSVVNRLELEDYVKGILYHEASHYWPMEALKAQAIVSRTYALYQIQENANKDYDVTSDIYSQVYGGQESERYRTNRAVQETKGYILTYEGKIFPAYFHATCGGHTEDASLLWDTNIACLKGVVCNFCQDSPHFNWHYVLSLEEIAEKLRESGHRVSNIQEITITAKDESGRITDLKIIAPTETLKISAKDFRNIIGPNVIRSTNFSMSVAGQDAVFEGLGWGHGVGLCQWGAYFMAKQGKGCEEILKYYYPGAALTLTLNP